MATPTPSTPSELRTGRLTRSVTIGRLVARRIVALAATRIRGVAATEQQRRELDEQFAIRTADDVVRELGSMKGAAMKVGQMLSFQLEGLPPAAQRSLSSLQAQVPPMAPSLAEQVIETSLGKHPDRLFLHWDPEPVAAASIGQVHKATLFSGTEVAVKVQYPGVAEAISADLANAKWLHRMLSAVALRNLDIDEMVTELRARMDEEVDYRLEAARQQRFAERYRDHPFVHVPNVHPRLSSDVVLTTDWADGVSWDEFEATASDADRQWLAEALFRFVQGAIYRFNEFNGDPHPGNYRIVPGERLTILDFGLVKTWTTQEMDDLWPIIDPLLAEEKNTVVERAVAAGFLAPDHGLTVEHIWDYVSGPYIPFLGDEFTFTRDFTEYTLKRMVDVTGPFNDVLNVLSMPASFVLLDRVVWGLTALLGRLEAHNTWRAMLAEYREEAQPATDLGRQESEWVQTKGGWPALVESVRAG